MITINIPKAQEITKDRLRTERAPLLQALDVQFIKALESGQDTAEIAAEKQRLRDVTKLVDNLVTVEELKAVSCEPGGV